MKAFADLVQPVVVKHGVACDRLNKDLEKMLQDAYISGLREGAKLECYDADFVDLAVRQVEATKRTLGDV